MEHQFSELTPEKNQAIKGGLKRIQDDVRNFTQSSSSYSSEQESSFFSSIDTDIKGNIWRFNALLKILIGKLGYEANDINRAVYNRESLQAMLTLPEDCRSETPPESRTNVKKRARGSSNRQLRGPYRSYTVKEKERVVRLHQYGKTFASISKDLGIPQKNVVRWCRESEKGKKFNARSPDNSTRERLANWLNTNSQQSVVSFTEVQEKAMELMKDSSFKPSKLWIRRFLKQEDPYNKLCINEE